MTDHLSRHVDNDDARHFSFARTSRLPIGYFDSRRWYQTWDWIAVVLAAAVIIAVLCGWNPNP